MRLHQPIYQDTESCGFYGPTILIQYALGPGDVTLHNIWKEPVRKTLDLIEWMMNHKGGIIGYNQAHDQYHYNKTYGILKMLPPNDPPEILDYYDCEKEDESKDLYCVKPVKCLDLMLYGRKSEFQATMNQKDIRIKRVPRALAKVLVQELQARVKIPAIYFSKSKKGYRWEIVPIHDETKKEVTPEEVSKARKGELQLRIDPNFVNLRLKFSPTTAMKAIVEKVLGFTDVETIDKMPELPKPEEYGWWPSYGDGWLKVIDQHIDGWTYNKRRLEYAKNDVVYTRAIDEYFGYPDLGDDDSELACAVGAMFWRGFAVDVPAIRSKYAEVKQKCELTKAKVNINAPKQVLKFFHEVCSPLQKVVVKDTKKETLDNIMNSKDWLDSNPKLVERVKMVVEGRHLFKELDLYDKLIRAGRLHVIFKVIGTKSNRMSGGSESYLSRGGSINPQGVKKGSSIRALFLLAFADMVLCGGDFDSFEVSIAEARYGDPKLRERLMSGLKFHGIMGSFFYKKPYEEILATSEINKNEPDGLYARAKTADFGWFYGAQVPKLAQTLWLEEEEVEGAFAELAEEFPMIREAQRQDYEDFTALRQPNGPGTKVEWFEPKEYVESFLGFKRYFTMEWSVVRALYDLAQDPSKEILDIGKKIKVVRSDRLQTGTGAVRSALYGAAFGIQGQIQRSAANHKIQSPGGQKTKELQRKIWDFQPAGIHRWLVMPLNCHDEVQCPVVPELVEAVKDRVNETVESFKSDIPLAKMKWLTNLKSWGH